MQRAVSSLPLSSGWLAKLASCGFEIIDDLKDVGVIELSRGYYSEDRGFLRNFLFDQIVPSTDGVTYSCRPQYKTVYCIYDVTSFVPSIM